MLTNQVRSLSISGCFPEQPESDRRRLTDALRCSYVDEKIHIECVSIFDKMKFEEQIVLANTLRAPHLPRISKYHIDVIHPFEKSDPHVTLNLISTMEELNFESPMCLAGIREVDLRQATSLLSLRSLTFKVPKTGKKNDLPHQLEIHGKELSGYVAARRAHEEMRPYLLGTPFLNNFFPNDFPVEELGKACEEAWEGTETAAALARVNKRCHGIAQDNREKVFRERTWPRVEQCLRETKSERDVDKRYRLVRASVGRYGSLYPSRLGAD